MRALGVMPLGVNRPNLSSSNSSASAAGTPNQLTSPVGGAAQEQVRQLIRDMEETENFCVACHKVENVRNGGCCKALMCHECIQMQTRATGLCPVCKVPLKKAQWVDLPTALKMH